jgi:hypothetical protein
MIISTRGNGNDTLDGGAGNDELRGYGGNDTFIFSEGFDIVAAGAGTDTLYIPEGYTLSDVAFFRDGDDLRVLITDLGQALLVDQHRGLYDYHMEQMYFAENVSDRAFQHDLGRTARHRCQ